ncbi:MAG: 50S ribosomal protein L17 [candidate division FCPU426 bacterium]
MRHRTAGRKLGVPTKRRKAMLRQLVEAVLLHGRIKTTITRAKAAQPLVERMVTLAKRGTLHHRRQAMAFIPRQDVVNRLFDQIVEWYKQRQGGYTRIIKIGPRPGDGAPMAFIELVDWIPGDKLPGQLTKIIRVEETDEAAKSAKDKKAKEKKEAKKADKKDTKKDAKKEAKKDAKKDKTQDKETSKRTPRDAEKEKRIAERRAEKEHQKKTKAAERARKKQEKQKPQGHSAAQAKKPNTPK